MITLQKKTRFIPGENNLEPSVIENKKEAVAISNKGYQLTPTLFKKLSKYFKEIIITENGKEPVNCKIISITDKVQVQEKTRSKNRWSFQIENLCNNVNNKSITFEFIV